MVNTFTWISTFILLTILCYCIAIYTFEVFTGNNLYVLGQYSVTTYGGCHIETIAFILMTLALIVTANKRSHFLFLAHSLTANRRNIGPIVTAAVNRIAVTPMSEQRKI